MAQKKTTDKMAENWSNLATLVARLFSFSQQFVDFLLAGSCRRSPAFCRILSSTNKKVEKMATKNRAKIHPVLYYLQS
jgi:hypothetical protein